MKHLSLAVIAVVLFSASALHAQSGSTDGCISSPENPTAILALVGASGAGLASLRLRKLRSFRIKANRNKR